jgi:hypothetical protein
MGKMDQKDPNWLGVPIVIVETVPFGSRHRLDNYDHPQGISEVNLTRWTVWGSMLVLRYGPEILALSELF